ncbi:Opsin-1 [Papilio xuthus]|uniref:Opsin-1 n=1 Tax=Papilio xuthus TaxID=66420 RepID=A0A194PJY9_PAPXU|nr:Opsin-1 [Papilio xuthus]
MTVTYPDPGVGVTTLEMSGAQNFGSNQTVADKVTADMIHLVDPHWYQFPPMDPLWHSLLGLTIGILGIVSIIGNGMVVYIFTTTKAVAAHEKTMRQQAKKMNVASLRSVDDTNTSAECKLAKVALMTISLWFMAWTPYTVINYTGVFETASISPLATIWGSVFAKANAVYNPIVYGISHPKYRAALYQKFPSLSCQPSAEEVASVVSGVTTCCDEKPSA